MPLTPNALERRSKRYLLKRSFDLFVPVTPGFEAIVLDEVTPLVASAEIVTGGVAIKGGLDSVYDLNLLMRTGNRVLLRLADFLAQSYPMLYDHARKLPWEVFLRSRTSVSVSASASASRLRHMDHIERVVFEAAQDRLAGVGVDINQVPRTQAPATGQPDAAGGNAPLPQPIRVLARLHQDRCTISIDTSGDHLHRRGYRRSVVEAPIRETLAAALLEMADVDAFDVVVDPFAGSGTFAIEADGLLRHVPAGARRDFAIQRMPIHRPGTFAHRLRLALEHGGGVHDPQGPDDQADTAVASTDAASTNVASTSVASTGKVGTRDDGTGGTSTDVKGTSATGADASATRREPAKSKRILASDIDAGAIRAAMDNAARAGASLPSFRQADALTLDLDALLGPGERGLVVANLPYGVRLVEPGAARRLAEAFLDRLSALHGAWEFVLVTPRFDLRARPGVHLARRLTFRNGGLDVVATFGRAGARASAQAGAKASVQAGRDAGAGASQRLTHRPETPAAERHDRDRATARQDSGPAEARQERHPAQARQGRESAKARHDRGPAKTRQDRGPTKTRHDREPTKTRQDREPVLEDGSEVTPETESES